MGGFTPGELAAVRGRLEGFADDIFESLPRKDQRARGVCYLRGLMLDGRRKSIEPMTQRLGGEVLEFARSADRRDCSSACGNAAADPDSGHRSGCPAGRNRVQLGFGLALFRLERREIVRRTAQIPGERGPADAIAAGAIDL